MSPAPGTTDIAEPGTAAIFATAAGLIASALLAHRLHNRVRRLLQHWSEEDEP